MLTSSGNRATCNDVIRNERFDLFVSCCSDVMALFCLFFGFHVFPLCVYLLFFCEKKRCGCWVFSFVVVCECCCYLHGLGVLFCVLYFVFLYMFFV